MELNDRIEQTIINSSLVAGYLKSELNEAQQAELLNWINETEHNRNLFEKLCNETNLNNAYALFNLFDEEAALAKVKNKPDFVLSKEQETKKTTKLWLRISIAAAVATIVISAGLFYYNKVNKEQPVVTAYKNDVAPGKQGAILTLANGRRISLSEAANGELAKEAGVVITKSADGQLVYQIQENTDKNVLNTISTARGETYQLRLPDGSSVWLNAASSLTYLANLGIHGERRVKLNGEGYFEIAKDKEHPFIVETGNQEVEVVGTHFNINSYKDEQAIKTTLLEGSVKVHAGNDHKILTPGQQAINTSGQIRVSAVDVDNVIDWKNNEFLLDNQNLQSSLRKIARWYDLEVIYAPDASLDIEIGGGISRNSKLSSVLKLIESMGLVHFRIDGRKLYVDK